MSLRSRKLTAYLFAEGTWKLLIAGGIYQAQCGEFDPAGWTLLWAMTATTGFLEVSYILGQSYVDRYVGLLRGTEPPPSAPAAGGEASRAPDQNAE